MTFRVVCSLTANAVWDIFQPHVTLTRNKDVKTVNKLITIELLRFFYAY